MELAPIVSDEFRALLLKEMRGKMARAQRARYLTADERERAGEEARAGQAWHTAAQVHLGRGKMLDFSLAEEKKLCEVADAGDLSVHVPAYRN